MWCPSDHDPTQLDLNSPSPNAKTTSRHSPPFPGSPTMVIHIDTQLDTVFDLHNDKAKAESITIEEADLRSTTKLGLGWILLGSCRKSATKKKRCQIKETSVWCDWSDWSYSWNVGIWWNMPPGRNLLRDLTSFLEIAADTWRFDVSS